MTARYGRVGGDWYGLLPAYSPFWSLSAVQLDGFSGGGRLFIKVSAYFPDYRDQG